MTRTLAALVAVTVRPRLWWVAAQQALRIARPEWWRRAPYLPFPDSEYLRFRLETAYGEMVVPRAADLVAYLEWCAELPRGLPMSRSQRRR